NCRGPTIMAARMKHRSFQWLFRSTVGGTEIFSAPEPSYGQPALVELFGGEFHLRRGGLVLEPFGELYQSLFERDPGSKAEYLLSSPDICKAMAYIAGSILTRYQRFVLPFTNQGADQTCNFENGDRPATPNVDDRIHISWYFQGEFAGVGHIVNGDEVSFLPAIFKHHWGSAS